MKKSNLIITILVIAAAGFFLWALLRSGNQSSAPTNVGEQGNTVATTTAFEARTNSEGGVEVEVQPLDLTSSEWIFSVGFNTHSGSLDEDLLKSVTLSDDRGDTIAPLRWEGPPPGGHHRNGTLIFPQIAPRPSSITIAIRGIGGVADRKFVWQLKGQ